jgi:hypothetical protein
MIPLYDVFPKASAPYEFQYLKAAAQYEFQDVKAAAAELSRNFRIDKLYLSPCNCIFFHYYPGSSHFCQSN